MTTTRRSGRILAVVILAVVIAGGAAALAVSRINVHAQPPPARALPPASAKVTRTTLTETETVEGTLSYGPSNPLTSRLPGTVTWVAAESDTVRRGQALYTVDTKPVVLLYGSVPAFRTLEPGTMGADVHQFEDNLTALGYTGFTAGNTYTDAVAHAVKHWQQDLGIEQTGTVELGRVVFLPGDIRIAQVTTRPGRALSADAAVLSYTGTVRLVTVDLDVAKRPLVRQGNQVKVTLPGHTEVTAEIATIGTVATATGQGQPQNNQQSNQAGRSGGQPNPPQVPGANAPRVPVALTVADQAALGDLDGAPVTVRLVSQRRENILAVPIAALLALPAGGYGVQVIEGMASRILEVQTGLFAGGLVEVSGTDITEGVVVGMPAS